MSGQSIFLLFKLLPIVYGILNFIPFVDARFRPTHFCALLPVHPSGFGSSRSRYWGKVLQYRRVLFNLNSPPREYQVLVRLLDMPGRIWLPWISGLIIWVLAAFFAINSSRSFVLITKTSLAPVTTPRRNLPRVYLARDEPQAIIRFRKAITSSDSKSHVSSPRWSVRIVNAFAITSERFSGGFPAVGHLNYPLCRPPGGCLVRTAMVGR